MIYDIYQIGKSTSDQGQDGDMEALYKTDSISDINYILSIDFVFSNEVLAYQGISIIEHNPNLNSDRYLLRKGGANGPNYGPSAKKTEYPKTVEKKLLAWFKDAAKAMSDDDQDGKMMQLIADYMQENLSSLCEDLQAKEPADKKAKILLTIKVNEKYPQDIPAFFACYKSIVEKKVVGEGEELKGTCCLCKAQEQKLIPAVNVFKFYTKDKPGFISGGFQEDMFWRNCPVCTDCEPILRKGKQYMLDHLRFRFYGLDYYILPSTTQYHTTKELTAILDEIDHRRFSFQKAAEDEVRSADEEFLDYLKEESDIHSFRIVFFKQENSAERILLDMKDIFPSRFKELYDARNMVKGMFEAVSKQSFNFRFYRDFLSKTEKGMRNNDLDALFLTLTQAIFLKEKIGLEVLLPHYLREIRSAFLEDSYFRNTVLKALIGIRYLQEICCMEKRGVEKVMEKRDEKIASFLAQYDTGFDTPLIQMLVLAGVLVQKVLNIQAYNLNGATPFVNRLKGFKMRQDDVMGLLKEGVSKMREYDSFSVESKKLYGEISRLIGNVPSVWPITTDKINFYISAGMALADECYEMMKEESK